MLVTIVPVEGWASVDSVGYFGVTMASVPANVHAVQWYGSYGEIEFKPVDGVVPANERIENLDAFKSVLDSWEAIDYAHKNPPPPPPPTAAENKATAVSLLSETDWAELPSVSSVTATPHLLNYTDFISYRVALRDIAVNPQAGVLVWPVKPEASWSTN